MGPTNRNSRTQTFPFSQKYIMKTDTSSSSSSSNSITLPYSLEGSVTVAASTTNPAVFLFGYGSLISKESRLRTLQRESAAAIPCQVKGLQRSWSYKCPKKSYTAVSVSRTSPEITTNGVLIPLSDPVNDLKELDSREFYYARGVVALEDIVLLPSLSSATANVKPLLHETEKRLPANAIVYVYENHNLLFENWNTNSKSQTVLSQVQHSPCAKFPIPQSYVDCILSGCLYYGEDFARDFVKSTHGWCYESFLQDRSLNNDCRKYTCRKEESYSFCKNTIDTLLSEVLVCNRKTKTRL